MPLTPTVSEKTIPTKLLILSAVLFASLAWGLLGMQILGFGHPHSPLFFFTAIGTLIFYAASLWHVGLLVLSVNRLRTLPELRNHGHFVYLVALPIGATVLTAAAMWLASKAVE
jgi:hypothetical protein